MMNVQRSTQQSRRGSDRPGQPGRRFAVAALVALAVGTTAAQSVDAVDASCEVDTDYSLIEAGSARTLIFLNADTPCTWTAPAGVSDLQVLVVGGGGGGGGGLNTDNGRAGGGGGGGGEVSIESGDAVAAGDEFTVTLGAFGALGGGGSDDGTVAATDGGAGGESSFVGDSLELVAAGGEGGEAGDPNGPVGGAGGDSGNANLGGEGSGTQGGQGASETSDGAASVDINPGVTASIAGTEISFGNGGGGGKSDGFGSSQLTPGSGGKGGRGSIGTPSYGYGYNGTNGEAGVVIVSYTQLTVVELTLAGIPATAAVGDQIDFAADLSVECQGGSIEARLTDPQGDTTVLTSGSIDTSGLAPGTYTITVAYSGDEICSSAVASKSVAIEAGATTTTTPASAELPKTGTGSNGSLVVIALMLLTFGAGSLLVSRRAPSR